MSGFPLGLIILIVIFVLVISELANHILNSIHIKKSEMYIVIILTFLGSYINIPFNDLIINLGGTLMPIIITILIIYRAENLYIKDLFIPISSTAISFFIGSLFIGIPFAQTKLIDPLYFTPIIAGIIAYFSGRNLKISFISAIIGVLLGNILYYISFSLFDKIVENSIGGRGFFDSIIFAGIIAVLTTEIVEKIKFKVKRVR